MPLNGHVAEWLRNGLQNRVPRFNSGRGLHSLGGVGRFCGSKTSNLRLSSTPQKGQAQLSAMRTARR